MSTPDQLLENNRAWSARIREQSPELFAKLAEGQSPDILWIGCADSRVPANQIVDCQPGELFVHRNVANVITETDLNALSVLQYAVEALGVSHVIVCGHYRCGGVQAVLSDSAAGVLGHWLKPVRSVVRRHADELEGLDHEASWDRCCELNVEAQVRRIARTPILQQAWEQGQDVSVHGWIYQLEDGRIRDLDVSVTGETFA